MSARRPQSVPDSGSVADAIDRVSELIGRWLSWLTVACVLVCFTVVVLRYVFSVGFI